MVILPVVKGICLQNTKEIRWKNKWIWIYLVPSVAFCLWVMCYEQAGDILLGYAIAFLPVAYWSIYERHGRSIVQLLLLVIGLLDGIFFVI